MAEADQSRDTKDTWSGAIALNSVKPNLSPPLFAYVKKPVVQAAVRSYAVWDDFVFPPRPDSQTSAFQEGDVFAVNVNFKQSGPRPVELLDTSAALYIKPDAERTTQVALMNDFMGELRKEEKLTGRGGPSTLEVGEHRFGTAFEPSKRRVIQADLDKLKLGEKIVFVMAQITYKDLGTIHHARRCAWLQPPAYAAGIWHFCEVFGISD
ncbi:MAG TPA: hypothetical protein VFA89_07495 [Terriglobales bacterium]|nr:hypothetical protein [Terriglobales bacterium]